MRDSGKVFSQGSACTTCHETFLPQNFGSAHLMSSPYPGWSTTLAAGLVNGARGFWFFKINLTLTEEGQGILYCNLVMAVIITCDCLDHVNDIVAIVFQYVAMLRSCGAAQQWIFKECSVSGCVFCMAS